MLLNGMCLVRFLYEEEFSKIQQFSLEKKGLRGSQNYKKNQGCKNRGHQMKLKGAEIKTKGDKFSHSE